MKEIRHSGIHSHETGMKMSILTMIRLCAPIVCLLVSADVCAQVITPPEIHLQLAKTQYVAGEPVQLDVTLVNTTPEIVWLGPVSLGQGHLTVQIDEESRGNVISYPGFAGRGGPWVESDLTGISPGGERSGTLALNLQFPLFEAGNYTASVGYPTFEKNPYPDGEAGDYTLSRSGFVFESVQFEIIEPPPGLEAVVERLSRAVYTYYDWSAPDSLALSFDEMASSVGGTILEGTVAYYHVAYRYFRYRQGADGVAPPVASGWNANTLVIVDQALTIQAIAPYAPSLLSFANAIRAEVNPPVGVDPRLIGISAKCGDDVFSVSNANDQVVNVLLEWATGSRQVEVQPATEEYVQLTETPSEVWLQFESQVIGFAERNASTCSDVILEIVEGSGVPAFTTLPAAATISSSTVEASFSGNSFSISGFDHDLSGSATGSGDDRHGIAVADEAARQSILDELSANQEGNVTGTDPAPDVAVASPGLDVEALVDLLLAHPDLVTLEADPGNQTVGSTAQPAVAYAPDGLDVQGTFGGTGILIVEGTYAESLALRGNASWTGLVIVRGQNGAEAQFDMSGSVEVIGAVVLVSDTGAVLDVGGSSSVRFSKEALQLAQSLLDAP